MAEQPHLFPLRVEQVWNPQSSTMSQPRFGRCEDGLDYCIKHDEGGVSVRANEMVGTWLARSAGIAVAPTHVVEDFDKKLLFGSQIYEDDVNDNMGIFQEGGLSANHLAHIVKTFALDLFIMNTDRHVNQYKIFKQNHESRIISFDFGQSLFLYWPDLVLPIDPGCHTISNMRAISNLYRPIDWSAAEGVLQRLEAIEGQAMVSLIRSLPKGGLDRRVGDSFTKWFGGKLRRDRVACIREGLRNGTCL